MNGFQFGTTIKSILLCRCLICSSVVIIPATLDGELPADRRNAAFTCLINDELTATAKLCLKRFASHLLFAMFVSTNEVYSTSLFFSFSRLLDYGGSTHSGSLG